MERFRIQSAVLTAIGVGALALGLTSLLRKSLPNRGLAQVTGFVLPLQAQRPYCGVPVEPRSCDSVTRASSPAIAGYSVSQALDTFTYLSTFPGPRREQSMRFAPTAQERLANRAAALENYWRQSTERIAVRVDLHALTPQSVEGESEFISDVDRLGTVLIPGLHRVLTSSGDPSEIIRAAAYWWAYRGMQLRHSCFNRVLAGAEGARDMVLDQYGHQTCRRSYMQDAIARLNGVVSSGRTLRLTSPEWLLVNVLGSRRERANLVMSAVPILTAQMRQASNGEAALLPTEPELNWIANQVLQTAEELSLRQVLTWNGLQPASDVDMTTLAHELQSLRTYMEECQRVATTLRSSHRDFYRTVSRMWERAHSAAGLQSQQSTGDDHLVSVRSQCHDGFHVGCVTWLEAMVGNSSGRVDAWQSMLSGSLRLDSFLQIANAFRDELLRAPERERRAWMRAAQNIANSLRNNARQKLLAPLPAVDNFRYCISEASWEQVLAAEAPPEDAGQFQVGSPFCSGSDVEPSRSFAERLAVVYHLFSQNPQETHWRDHPIAQAVRYASFVNEINWSRTGVRFYHTQVLSHSEANTVAQAWDVYLREPRLESSQLLAEHSMPSRFWLRGDRAERLRRLLGAALRCRRCSTEITDRSAL